MAFGKRELFPHPMAQFLKVSKKLIRASQIDVEALVRERLAYKAAVVQENAFLNGSGAMQPLGVFTASADGITTSQDVSTGNATNAFTADGLINCKMNLPAQYRRNCNWIFHRDAVLMLMKLKDGDGQYIWRPGLLESEPDVLLSVPVRESE